MRPAVGGLSWVEWDARMAIAARATRSFAQSAVAVLIAIYLGLHGFSLVQVGAFLTVGAVGAALAAVVAGVLGDAVGRRRTLVTLSGIMALAGIVLVMSENFPLLLMAAFVGNLSGFAGGGGTGPLEQAILAVSVTPHRRTDLFALSSIAGTIAGALGALASGMPTLLQHAFGLGALASFRPMFVAYAVLAVLTALLYGHLSSRVELPSGAARVDDLHAFVAILASQTVISVIVADLPALLQTISPAVLVDARMRKHLHPEVRRGMAPLTIGLGPNFVAGETTGLAVETQWGDDLGRVLAQGMPQPLGGEPCPIAGYARDRYVYAPVAGVFHTALHIGDPVRAGHPVAHLEATVLTAPLDGVLRGLTRDGVPVTVETKVIEVDPRGPAAVVTGLGERPRRIAQGVLQAVQRWAQARAGQKSTHSEVRGARGMIFAKDPVG